MTATDRLRHGGMTQIIEKTQSKIRQYYNRLLFIEHNKPPEQANLIGQIISLFMKRKKLWKKVFHVSTRSVKSKDVIKDKDSLSWSLPSTHTHCTVGKETFKVLIVSAACSEREREGNKTKRTTQRQIHPPVL